MYRMQGGKYVVCCVGGGIYNTAHAYTRKLENALGPRWLVICTWRARGKSCADGKSEDELNVTEAIEVKKKSRGTSFSS